MKYIGYATLAMLCKSSVALFLHPPGSILQSQGLFIRHATFLVTSIFQTWHAKQNPFRGWGALGFWGITAAVLIGTGLAVPVIAQAKLTPLGANALYVSYPVFAILFSLDHESRSISWNTYLSFIIFAIGVGIMISISPEFKRVSLFAIILGFYSPFAKAFYAIATAKLRAVNASMEPVKSLAAIIGVACVVWVPFTTSWVAVSLPAILFYIAFGLITLTLQYKFIDLAAGHAWFHSVSPREVPSGALSGISISNIGLLEIGVAPLFYGLMTGIYPSLPLMVGAGLAVLGLGIFKCPLDQIFRADPILISRRIMAMTLVSFLIIGFLLGVIIPQSPVLHADVHSEISGRKTELTKLKSQVNEQVSSPASSDDSTIQLVRTVVTVKRRDTLSKIILTEYGYYNEELARAVQGINPDIIDLTVIEPGQIILLPVLSPVN